MSQEVKSLNFACEANYTIRLCKEIITYHYPDKMPMGSFELIASNKVRSDEETLGEAARRTSWSLSASDTGAAAPLPGALPLPRERGGARRACVAPRDGYGW